MYINVDEGTKLVFEFLDNEYCRGRFLANYGRENGIDTLAEYIIDHTKSAYSFGAIIDRAFGWANTTEGAYFWSQKATKWRRKVRKYFNNKNNQKQDYNSIW